jgi:hypothetical protein
LAHDWHAQRRMPVIGMVIVNLKLSEWFLTGVRQGLAELGYVEGKDYRFEFRETNYQPIYRIMCQELVDQKVTLLLVGSTAALQVAKALTQSFFRLVVTRSRTALSPV